MRVRCLIRYNSVMPQQQMRKVTVMLPKDLVERATKATGVGLTPTIRKGLEAVAASDAYERILRRRGKVHLSIDVDELRRD
jgi:hypothetical protein